MFLQEVYIAQPLPRAGPAADTAQGGCSSCIQAAGARGVRASPACFMEVCLHEKGKISLITPIILAVPLVPRQAFWPHHIPGHRQQCCWHRHLQLLGRREPRRQISPVSSSFAHASSQSTGYFQCPILAARAATGLPPCLVWNLTCRKGGSSGAEDREGPAEQRTEFNTQKCICPTLPLLLHPKSVLPGVTQARLSDAVGQEQGAGHLRCE